MFVSEEYGSEEFRYDTGREAEKLFERLKREVERSYGEDEIDRQIYLVKDKFTTEGE